MNYKEWFARLSQHSPKTHYIGAIDENDNGTSTTFWEDMYQAFKQRLAAEGAINVWPEEK